MCDQNKPAIGVFDSGLGGLTILKYFLSSLPDYNYLYLGDNARVPYGEKSPEQIYQYTREAIDFLFSKGCRLVILACNTASAQALRRIQQEHLPDRWPEKKVLGVIRPLAEHLAKIAKQTGNIKTVGVIGTKATINSGAYATELKKLLPGLRVEERSAPLLVPLIEEGWSEKPEANMILKKYLRPLKQKPANALLLACTHYSFLIKKARQFMGRKVYVPEPGIIIAASLKDYLARHPELGIDSEKNASRKFFFTADDSNYQKTALKFLGQEIDPDKFVNIKL